MSVTELPRSGAAKAQRMGEEVAGSSVVSAGIATLPVWKAGSTASEWLSECAMLALEHPERFSRVVVVSEEYNKDMLPVKSRLYSWHHDHNTGIMGALQVAQLELFEHMQGRVT